MNSIERRVFLKGSLASAGLVALPRAWGQARGANDTIRHAVIGVRGKGKHHMKMFDALPGVKVVAICDPDREVLAERAGLYKDGRKLKTYVDLRRLLEDKDIDTVSVATPNHWHALATIWACQAGKDVYVEKPACHNPYEGVQMMAVAEKHGRIVQTGTQNRSDTGLKPAIEHIHSGALGAIKAVHGLCYKRRRSIGRVGGPQPIPQAIDYNLWSGPAPLVPLRRKRLHYDWHWDWPTGDGDIGNQGAHELDAALWALQQEQLPSRVLGLGGRFGYMDDATTPNTMLAVFDYKPAPLIFEVRGLAKTNHPKAAMDHYRKRRIGIVVYCEKGFFSGGRNGGWIYDNDGRKVQQFPGDGGAGHAANFIAAVRSRKAESLAAPLSAGVRSATLALMANISYRLGRDGKAKDGLEAMGSCPYATDAWKRLDSHLAANSIALDKTPLTLGPWLDFDRKTGLFTTKGDYDLGGFANLLARGHYRAPFTVPEKV